jgi:hypothetical protein
MSNTLQPKISPLKKKETINTILIEEKNDDNNFKDKSYHDHDIVYSSISSGHLFSRWDEDRDKLNNIINSVSILNIFDELFPKDSLCKGKLSQSRPYSLSQSCIGCQLLTRLFKRGEEGRNKNIYILAGDAMGREISINHISYSLDKLTSYTEEMYSKEYGIRALQSLQDMSTCEHGYSTRISDTRTFGTTSFISNYILISSILEYEMKLTSFPGIPIFRWIYECSDGLTIVEEKIGNRASLDILTKHSDYTKSPVPTSTASKIRSLRSDVARLLLLQLVMNLCFLNNYDFTHGEPCLNNIIITKEACVMKYENIKLECPFTVHIIPSGYSSLTLNVDNNLIRIFYKGNFEPIPPHLSEIAKITFSVNLGTPLLAQVCTPNLENKDDNTNSFCDEYKNMRVLSYKIGTSKTFDIYTRNMGIALFPSSFDTYAFFVALMAEEAFYQAVIYDDILLPIWRAMWLEKEYISVMEELNRLRKFHSENHTTPQYSMIRTMLSKFHLRCDGLKFLWNMLKSKIKV